MQLSQIPQRTAAATAAICATAAAITLCAADIAFADEQANASVTLYQEGRKGAQGGLTVLHPQLAVAGDVGNVAVGVAYNADVVTGATAAVYAVDAVSSATKFSDTRHVGALNLGITGKRASLSLNGSVGAERDYVSLAVGGSAAIELPGRNTSVTLAYSHSFDAVCDKDHGDATPLARRPLTGADPCAKQAGIFGKDTPGQTRWADISIDVASAALTQNLTPTTNLQLIAYGQLLSGLQSNPYRRVRIGPNEPQEHVPKTRARAALTVRVNQYVRALQGAVHLDARGYSDTWGVNQLAVETAVSKYLGNSVLFRLRARFAQQTAATFFKDAFYYETESSAGAYFTGDRELAPVQNITLGGKLTLITVAEERPVLGLFDRLEFNLKGDIMRLGQLAADDPAANPAGIDNQFLSGGNGIDAIMLQVGLQSQF